MIFLTLFELWVVAANPDPVGAALKPFKNQVGFSARRIDGTVISEVNAKHPFSPASVAKTISSACSLWAMGPEYQFETQFGYRGKFTNGVLDGDIVIRGMGDPTYVVEDLKENLERLYYAYGLKEIRGSLVIDTSYFEKPSLDISEDFDGDVGRSFRALLTPLAFDFNSFGIWAVPAFGSARVEVLPAGASSEKIDSNVKLVSGSSVDIGVDYQPQKKRVLVSGKLGESTEGKAIYRAVTDPYASFFSVFQRVWKDLGGQGPVKGSTISKNEIRFDRLFTHRSRSLSRILMDINKLSTNFGAEMTLLTGGAEKFGAPASFDKSQRLLKECLKHYQFSNEEIRLDNASGLSRTSSLAASAHSLFLAKIFQEDFAPEYLSSLSILGKDGTTKSRLKSYAGRARLKTGTLKGVRSIAGFVWPKVGKPIAFSLLFNCPSCADASMLSAEDQILRQLIEGVD